MDTTELNDEPAEIDLSVLLGRYERDPYPEWARRRALGGVQEGGPSIQPIPPELLQLVSGGTVVYTAYSWDAVQTVLRTPADFSSTGYDDSIGLVMGHMILGMDPPEHISHRALVAQAFRMKEMQSWESAFIEPLVNEFIDAFIDRGHADLVAELTSAFPVQVIAAILGLPRDDWATFQKLSADLIDITSDPTAGLVASASLRDYFAGILGERRASPQQDLISVLAAAEVDGTRLTDEEIFSFLRLLLPAGAETTSRSSSSLLFLLLTHPEQYDAVRNDRSLLPQAIDEALRLEPPLTSIARTATRDVELEGTVIPAGAAVTVCMGAANRDPAIRDRPDEFDIHRASTEHVAFATGPHMCLGMHLARVETRAAVNALMDRLPNLRIDTANDPHIEGVAFRSPPTLPVRWG